MFNNKMAVADVHDKGSIVGVPRIIALRGVHFHSQGTCGYHEFHLCWMQLKNAMIDKKKSGI